MSRFETLPAERSSRQPVSPLASDLLSRACRVFMTQAYPQGEATIPPRKLPYFAIGSAADLREFLPPADRATGIARDQHWMHEFLMWVCVAIFVAVFSVLYLKEPLRWNYIVGFVLILAAVFFVFVVGRGKPVNTSTAHDARAVAAAEPEA